MTDPVAAADEMLDPASWNILTSMPRLPALTMSAELEELAAVRDDIVVLTADLASSNGLDAFERRYPDRFVNTGIAEQNMMSLAAGMASTGMIPFVSTFASFASLLCAEQLRTDLAYTKMKVRILAHHAGISMGFYGTSHHAVEDIAVTRAMGNMTVVSAADGNAIRGLIRTTIDLDGPVYIRIGRGAEKQVYAQIPDFAHGRFVPLREGDAATVIATGLGVKAAIDAAEALAQEGIAVRVLDAVYLKPIDREAILAAARETGGILTVEEHNPYGGLGSAVAEVIAEAGLGIRFAKHALPDDYALVAPPTQLYRHYGLTGPGVADAVRKLLA
ncbi:transketolase family protein [Sphingomonas immobilis]|uniref:Transketolase C-terminal domain-containing protein n=1 Tax=Sphingomonas immobilis TaxID=3063997 RepID=A0ABT8ZX81_9SPHN|nr:transketolase C-terminal domain-containing protein [Sphingomonas sp. CA1-15]MDO7842168.1 transketolase C-terminal domain-containing protein [Sphingomonas sp. CA1-15]